MALQELEKRAAGGPMITQTGMIILMWVGVAVSVAFVILRTHIQYRVAKRFYLNDYLIFASVVLYIVSAILYQYAIPPMYQLVEVGMGLRPMPATFASDGRFFLQLQFAVDFTMWTALWLVKFSLLYFFWRLFDSVDTPMRIFWWFMTLVTGATLVVAVVIQCHACDPISNFFILGACSKPRDIFMSNLVFRWVSGTDIAGDILIMCIPFPLLRKLKVSKQQRLVLITIFLLPILPIIFAILRLTLANATTGNVDPLQFQIWSMLQIAVAIITSCIPSIRLFVVKQGNMSGSSKSRKYYGHGYGNGVSTASANHPFGRSQKGSIPLRSLTDVNGSEGGEDTQAIFVKQDFSIETRRMK